MNKPTIKIDVVSDVVCPWCYIGKRRLEKAVDQLKDKYNFQIEYHPFELNPDTPKDGYDQKIYLSNKFGGEDRYLEITENTTNVAAEDGLSFNFAIQKKSPNTFDAHRIIFYSQREGKQAEIVEAFYEAYFTKGIDLTKTENLIAVATEAGLTRKKVEAFLLSDEGIKEVREMENHGRSIGITGVPFFIINNKYAVSGAQPAEFFLNAIPDISSKTTVEGQSCEVGENC
jgi:predicted DsbA family dithiol-disulfide isomerase